MDLGPWLCVDSFVACLALGWASPARGDAVRLAFAFGACDAAASAAGCFVPSAYAEPALAEGAWLALSVALGLLAARSRLCLVAAPALLGMDNLLESSPASLAPALGAASAAAAFAGLTLGRRLAARPAVA